jgi:hypothetical protein
MADRKPGRRGQTHAQEKEEEQETEEVTPQTTFGMRTEV